MKNTDSDYELINGPHDSENASSSGINRRSFNAFVGVGLASVGLGTHTTAAIANDNATSAEKIPLGMDNFSIRANKWKADRLIEFAAEQKLDSILLSDLDVYESHETKYLKELKAKADDAGIVIHAGTGGICPTAKRFIKKWGTAEEHLKLGIRIANDLGSPVFRCYLGGQVDRQSEGGIDKHIDATVAELKKVKTFAIDSNVKIAVENHAGDMQGWELVLLIQAAGSEFVGSTIDSGNATWTLESPDGNLQMLGPFAASSGMRDSTIWMDEKGAVVAWNAIGEGQVDWKTYTKQFAKLAPGVPFQLEIISGFNKSFPFKQKDFWNAYKGARAEDFEEFLQMARGGKAIPKGKAGDADFQMAELLRSIKYCKETLGMGLK